MNKENTTLHWQNLSLETLPGEEWEDIEDFEGYYMISSFGRVKSLSRKVYAPKRACYISVRARILKQKRLKAKPALKVILAAADKGMIKEAQVSHLVAIHFLEEPLDRRFVFHKDLNARNNHYLNLFWGTEDDYSAIQHKIKNQKETSTRTYSNLKGVVRLGFKMSIHSSRHNLHKNEYFKTEEEAAKKYDYYVKKYNLNRSLNFPAQF